MKGSSMKLTELKESSIPPECNNTFHHSSEKLHLNNRCNVQFMSVHLHKIFITFVQQLHFAK